MAYIREYSPALEGNKNLTRKYLKNSYTKTYLSSRVMLEKNLTPLYVRKKNFYHGRFLGKNFYPNQITHNPLKSQMVGP